LQPGNAAARTHRVDPAIARENKVTVKRLEKPVARTVRIGPIEQILDRMPLLLASAIEHHPGHRGGGLGDHPRGTVRHRIAHEAFAGDRRVGAPAPACARVA
jgi:hypothetical protein